MSIIEKFVDFTRTLDAARLAEVEHELVVIMATNSEKPRLTAEQMAEDDRRFDDPNPEYADPADINTILGSNIAS